MPVRKPLSQEVNALVDTFCGGSSVFEPCYRAMPKVVHLSVHILLRLLPQAPEKHMGTKIPIATDPSETVCDGYNPMQRDEL